MGKWTLTALVSAFARPAVLDRAAEPGGGRERRVVSSEVDGVYVGGAGTALAWVLLPENVFGR